MKFGLIGHPLGHSYSSRYFARKFGPSDFSYANIDLQKDELSSFLTKTDLDGFNVTIPYKVEIIKHLDAISDTAQSIGAVNCVKRINQKWIGHNTDLEGFLATIAELDLNDHEVLILGTGGASKAVREACKLRRLKFRLVSRTPDKGQLYYPHLGKEDIDRHRVIINTTPLGMYPDIQHFPDIPYEPITSDHICIDLIYNPKETLFLKKSKAHGAHIINGMVMFEQQAEASLRYWLSTDP